MSKHKTGKTYHGRECPKGHGTLKFAHNYTCVECTREKFKRWHAKRDAERVVLREQKLRERREKLRREEADGTTRLTAQLARAKTRARKVGRAATITVADLRPFPTHCPILGLELDYGGPPGGLNTASLDRIDNRVGYVPGNVAIISYKANTIKSYGTPEEHRRIADWTEDNDPLKDML